MTFKAPLSQTTTIFLNAGEDLFVGSDVTISVSGNFAVSGSGDSHNVLVYGTVIATTFDTINLGAPHWATIENIEPLEKELGINVVTGGQMIMWAGLRRCGITDSIKGYGRLLSDF